MDGLVALPAEHTILKFGMQHETIYMWALVDNECEKITARFKIVRTGWNLGDELDDYQHMETVFEKCLVWHIFMKV